LRESVAELWYDRLYIGFVVYFNINFVRVPRTIFHGSKIARVFNLSAFPSGKADRTGCDMYRNNFAVTPLDTPVFYRKVSATRAIKKVWRRREMLVDISENRDTGIQGGLGQKEEEEEKQEKGRRTTEFSVEWARLSRGSKFSADFSQGNYNFPSRKERLRDANASVH